MDNHLATLAAVHLETRFVKMEVERAPFLVERLKVRVLPCVIAFVGGVGVDRVVGFEGLGGGDGFETGDLERRLVGAGVLRGEMGGGDLGGLGGGVKGGNGGESGGGGGGEEAEEEDDDEWD